MESDVRKGLMVVCSLLLLALAVGCKGNLKSSNCTPQCGGKECGSDGCEGTCGACGPGNMCGTDGMCLSSFCGNGRIEQNESCDYAIAAGVGSCVLGCVDDGNSCTNEQFFGSPQMCDAKCTRFEIIECVDGDGCCPAACPNDSDCSLTCDDGVVDDLETCDPVASCPTDPLTDCPDDGDACTTPIVTGNPAACSSLCGTTDITDCIDDDGCCPVGCTPPDAGGDTADTDCDSMCGDGLVTGPENCDNAIVAPDMGFCPADPATDCPDPGADPCMVAEIVGMATDCSAVCNVRTITAVANGDGCCPAAGTPGTDDDCAAVCGNNIVESGETCDSMIAAGNVGACPPNLAACDDADACTTDAYAGTVAACTAECTNTDVMAPVAADGCCYFAGTVAAEIADCQSLCDDYCTMATTFCTEAELGVGNALFNDDNASGSALDECQTVCAAFGFTIRQPATVNFVDDDGFDTMACRLYHLGLADPAVDAMGPMTHCGHAVELLNPVCNMAP